MSHYIESTSLAPLPSTWLIDSQWLIRGSLWTPSVLLGLPTNILVLALSRQCPRFGNYRLIINNLCIINAVICFVRLVIVIYYFSHYFLRIPTNLLTCTIMSQVFQVWIRDFLPFAIPLLSLSRYVQICLPHGEHRLNTRRILVLITVFYSPPLIVFIGKTHSILTDASPRIVVDPLCGYRQIDSCVGNWCDTLIQITSIIAYAISAIFSALVFRYIYCQLRTFASRGVSSTLRRFNTESNIFMCITLQTIVPILLTIPLIVLAPYLKERERYVFVVDICSALFTVDPLIDALLIMYFIKPYRRSLYHFFVDTRRRLSLVDWHMMSEVPPPIIYGSIQVQRLLSVNELLINERIDPHHHRRTSMTELNDRNVQLQ